MSSYQPNWSSVLNMPPGPPPPPRDPPPEWEKAQKALAAVNAGSSPEKTCSKQDQANHNEYYSSFGPYQNFACPPPPQMYPRLPMYRTPMGESNPWSAANTRPETPGKDYEHNFAPRFSPGLHARSPHARPNRPPFRFRNQPSGGRIQFQLSNKRPVAPGNPLMAMRPAAPSRFTSPSSPQTEIQKHLAKADGFSPQPKKEEQKLPNATKVSDPFSSPEDWSPSLKAYVMRAFASVSDEAGKDEMERLLKVKLTNAWETDTEHLYNWDNEPLPGQQGGTKKNLWKNNCGKIAGRGRGKGIPTPRKSRWDNDKNENMASQKSWRGTSKRGIKSTPSHRYRSRSLSSSSSRSPRSKNTSRSRSRSPISRRRRNRHYSSDSYSSSSSVSSRSSHGRISSAIVTKSGNSRRGRGRRANNRLQKNTQNNKRGKRGKKNQKKGFKFESESSPVKTAKLQKRAARFGDTLSIAPRSEALQINTSISGDTGLDYTSMSIIGSNTSLRKQYLRLTTAPDASTVRPIHILKEALELVKKNWKQKRDYRDTCEQLKSIRQDLTVQCMRDNFTVHVYETHARIALETKDHEEFNQCQTQLKLLYGEGYSGNRREFVAYRMLYYIFTKNTLDMSMLLETLSDGDNSDECLNHALKVRSAWALNNYYKFFRLYKIAPMMSSYLMDWFIERERSKALVSMLKSYGPVLSVEMVHKVLSFDSDNDCLAFLTHKCVVYKDNNPTKINSKLSLQAIEQDNSSAP